jgi:hypothetical protein
MKNPLVLEENGDFDPAEEAQMRNELIEELHEWRPLWIKRSH